MKLLGLLLTPLLFAQPPMQNAHIETRAVAGTLDSTVRGIVNAAGAVTWIGYSMPRVAGDRDGNCSVELGSGNSNSSSINGTVHLEGAPEFFVLYRVENRQVDRIRAVSMDCKIDAGGLTVIWLTGVNAAQSVGLLETFGKSTERRLNNNVIAAIALHRDPSADAALDRFTAASQPEETRRQAAFWLGNARGRHGYESLLKMLHDDPSERVREHAIFALTQSKEPEAIPAIVRVAHDDSSIRVRGQALFWLAQRAGKQISEDAIRRAIEQDPETEVKKKAVFALTQMHNGDGVPLLIEIARNNHNAAVRKQAMFWLGQSKDPRALQFFETVLNTR